MNRRKRFFSYYRPYRWLFLADMLCAMLVAAISLLLPLLVRHITQEIAGAGLPGAREAILRTGLLALGLVALQAGFTYVYDYWGHSMGAMMERDMRGELFAHMQRQSFAFFDAHTTGDLMSRLTNDLLMLAELFHHGPEDFAIYAVQLVGAMIILGGINLPLTLIVFAILAVMTVFSLLVSRRVHAVTKARLAAVGEVNAQAEESISGARTVQAYTNEAYEAERFARRNERHYRGTRAVYRIESIFSIGVDSLSRLITVAVAVFGGLAILDGGLGLGDLLTFLLYTGYLTEPARRLGFILQQYQSGLAGFSRFMDLIERAPDIADEADAAPVGEVRGEIALEDVCFRYDDGAPRVLEGLSLTIRAGEHVALVGPSGAGKTTLCALLPRFYDPTAGRVLVDGRDVRGITLASLRQRIAVVQQQVVLFSGTVRENIRYGRPDATDDEVEAAAVRANADGFIRALPGGYEADLGHHGLRLSGGQRQRISIARAFLKDAPILILDEATSALDARSERAVQASLRALCEGRTTLTVAHRLSTVRDADRILVLTEDGIVEEGAHAALLEKGGVYARLYDERIID